MAKNFVRQLQIVPKLVMEPLFRCLTLTGAQSLADYDQNRVACAAQNGVHVRTENQP